MRRRRNDLPVRKCQHVKQHKRAERRKDAQEREPRRKACLFEDAPTRDHEDGDDAGHDDRNQKKGQNQDSVNRLRVDLRLGLQEEREFVHAERSKSVLNTRSQRNARRGRGAREKR